MLRSYFRRFSVEAYKEDDDLLDFLGKDPQSFAHVVIDPQSSFCDPKNETERGNSKTKRTSEHLARVVKDFREAGVPTYIVYFAKRDGAPVKDSGGGLYKVEAAPSDYLMWKRSDSAFFSGPLKETLAKNGHKNLLVSGFNTAACVAMTVFDARNDGCNVWVMNDCVDNGNGKGLSGLDDARARRAMSEEGAKFIASSTPLNAFASYRRLKPSGDGAVFNRRAGSSNLGCAL